MAARDDLLALLKSGGKTAWLVGASTGIGAALAEALHAAGATVAVSARSADKLQAFVDEHPGAIALPLDVADPVALREAWRQLVARTGGADLVLYCAGTYSPMRADAFDLAGATAQLHTNYLGALNLLDALLPALQSGPRAQQRPPARPPLTWRAPSREQLCKALSLHPPHPHPPPLLLLPLLAGHPRALPRSRAGLQPAAAAASEPQSAG